MVIKEVSASYGRKMSDNNYGSRDVFFSITAEIGPDEDAKEVQQSLFERCHELAMEQYQRGGESENRPVANFKTTQKPDWLIEGMAERSENHGQENGPRGSKFED